MYPPVEKEIPNYDAMEQIDANTIVYGFCDFNCSGLDDPKWSLLKVEKVGNVYLRRWAYGKKEKIHKFTDHTTITATNNWKFLL